MPHHRLTWTLILTGLLTACQPAATNLETLSKPEQRLFEQAASKRAEGQMDEAIGLYTQAAKLSTHAVEAHLAVAEILRSRGGAAQSMDMLQDALHLQPADARLHMEMGFALVAKGEYDAAIESFNTALRYDADLASAYSGKAIAYDLQGKHKQAQKLYSEAVARGLSSPAMDNNYALSLIFSGQYDAAIELLAGHVDQPYASNTMRQNLALAYGLKGDVGRAAEYGAAGLDPISAQKNIEFYKRFTAMKQGETIPRMAIQSGDHNAQKAATVSPVESSDIGFVTDSGKSNQVILKPSVEVIEMDAAAFEALVE